MGRPAAILPKIGIEIILFLFLSLSVSIKFTFFIISIARALLLSFLIYPRSSRADTIL